MVSYQKLSTIIGLAVWAAEVIVLNVLMWTSTEKTACYNWSTYLGRSASVKIVGWPRFTLVMLLIVSFSLLCGAECNFGQGRMCSWPIERDFFGR